MSGSRLQRRVKVMRFLESYVWEHRYAPTFHELAEHIGTDHITARQICAGLQVAGLVDWVEYQKRTLHLTRAGVQMLENVARETHRRTA